MKGIRLKSFLIKNKSNMVKNTKALLLFKCLTIGSPFEIWNRKKGPSHKNSIYIFQFSRTKFRPQVYGMGSAIKTGNYIKCNCNWCLQNRIITRSKQKSFFKYWSYHLAGLQILKLIYININGKILKKTSCFTLYRYIIFCHLLYHTILWKIFHYFVLSF